MAHKNSDQNKEELEKLFQAARKTYKGLPKGLDKTLAACATLHAAIDDLNAPNPGHLPCFVCNRGVLSYSRASNNHLHAACSTNGCLRFMQ